MALIPIGQFSRLARLSVKTLRHYDEKGLLKPAFVDPETRYRYYRRQQLHTAEMVRTLRSVDMPIEDIRAVLAAEDPAQLGARLIAHRERLAAQAAQQRRMLDYLEAMIHNEEIVMQFDIAIEEVAARHIASVKVETSLSRVGADIQAGFGRLVSGLTAAAVAPTGMPLLIYHQVLDEQNDGEIEVSVPVPDSFTGHGDLNARELPAGHVATTVHVGPYESIGPAYNALSGFIAENGHTVTGAPREIYLNDPQQVAPEDLRTRIEYPIDREN